MQRCYDFDEHIQTHHVTVNRQIAEAAATEIKRLEAALQEAKKEKGAQQEKARKARKVAQQATTKLAKSHFARERGSGCE